MPLRFLSNAWLDALQSALVSGSEATRTSERDGGPPRIAIGQLVTGTPSGDIAYTVVLGGSQSPRIEHGSISGASVTLVTDYETARSIAAGTSTPAAALGDGRLKVRGDTNALLEAQGALAALAPALEGLRDSTEF